MCNICSTIPQNLSCIPESLPKENNNKSRLKCYVVSVQAETRQTKQYGIFTNTYLYVDYERNLMEHRLVLSILQLLYVSNVYLKCNKADQNLKNHLKQQYKINVHWCPWSGIYPKIIFIYFIPHWPDLTNIEVQPSNKK